MENTNNTINNATVNKPISLVLEESKRSIIDAINSIGLHPTLLEMILKDIYNEARQNANMQYEREKNEYEKVLEKSVIEPAE